MAIKFSQFVVETNKANVNYLVGWDGAENVQITPADLLGSYPSGSGATGQVAFFDTASSIGGDNDLFFDNTNKRLGIGTATPTTNLNVSGNISVSSGSYLSFIDSNLNYNKIGRSTSVGGIQITTGANATMNLLDSGNVGIGTTSPSAKLEVDGTLIATGISQLGSGGANVYLTSSSAGNVGIGTSSPESKLTVKGDPNNTDQPVRITNNTVDAKTGLFINGTGNAPNQKYGMQFGGYNQYSIGGIFGVLDSVSGSTSGDITFDMCNGTSAGSLIERMRITHEGNVGIGTSSPGEKLEVNGNIKVIESGQTPDVSVFHSDGSYAKLRGQGLFLSRSTSYVAPVSDNFGSLAVGYNGARWGNVEINAATVKFQNGASEFMRIDSSGDVGIGTSSPNANLDILNGTTGASLKLSATSTAYWQLQRDPTTGNLNISDDGIGNVMSLDQVSGNVGIGTTSPIAPLTVTTPMSSSLTSTLYLDIDGTNTNGGGGQIVFGTSASSGDLTNYNAKITGTRVVGDGGDSELGFWTTLVSDNVASQQRMVITKEGNVGIGTTSPSGRLEVDGGVKIGDTTTGAQLIRNGNDFDIIGVDVGGNAFNSLHLKADSLTGLYIEKDTNNVGIGTTSPSAPLSFGKSTYGDVDTDAFYRIKFQDQGGVANDVGIGQTATGNLGFNITAGKDFLFNGGTSGNALTLGSSGNATFAGDVEIGNSADGLILKSPDGTRYRVTVANGGTLSVAAV